MKRKHNGKLSHLDADLKTVLRKIGKGQKGIHPEIWARWRDIMGEELSRRSVPRNFYQGTLVVAVASSTWMLELSYLKSTLLDRFAEEIGPGTVKEIRLVLDPAYLSQ